MAVTVGFHWGSDYVNLWACEALEDLQESRKKVEERFTKGVEKAYKILKGLDLSKPLPPEVGLHLNEELRKAIDLRKREMGAAENDLKNTLEEIHTLEVEDFKRSPERRLLTFVDPAERAPDLSHTFDRAVRGRTHQPDRSATFNRAAAIDL